MTVGSGFGFRFNSSTFQRFNSFSFRVLSFERHCLVDIDAHLRSDGKPKNLLIYGDFKSGEGSYGLIDFDSLQGTISSQHGILDFRDVYIMIDGDQIFAPYLRIVNGKLKLGSIYYESDGGIRKKLM